jgi:hypothetical protein
MVKFCSSQGCHEALSFAAWKDADRMSGSWVPVAENFKSVCVSCVFYIDNEHREMKMECGLLIK